MSRFDDGRGINDGEKKEFGKLVSNQKGGLSQSEINQFKKIVSEDNSKRIARDNSSSTMANSDVDDVHIREFLLESRKFILRTMNFNNEEIAALATLQRDSKSLIMSKEYFHFAFLTIDHIYFIREKLNPDDAVKGKLRFVLGVQSLKQLDEESRKTVLFRLVNLLIDYGHYAYSSNSVQVLDDLNDLISDFGSILSVAGSSREVMNNTSSLHLNILYDVNFKNKKFAYYVSDKNAETPEFKRVYDFYYKNEGKVAFEKAVLKHEKREKAETFFTKDAAAQAGVSQEVKRLIAKYSDSLDIKLASLRKRGDMF